MPETGFDKGIRMKWLGLSLMLIFLTNCSTSTTEHLADNATQTVNNLYNSLPNECKTETAKNLRDSSKKEIQGIVLSCKNEKALLGQKIATRNVIILLLCVLILSYVGGKVFLRVRR